MTVVATDPPCVDDAPRRRDVLRSEWTKLRTVRSTWWTLLVVFGGTVVLGLLICAAVTARWDGMTAAERASFDPTFRSLTGLFIAQLAIGVVGALAITSEYATGMIRSTLAAVPRRRAVLVGKAAALVPPALVVSTVGCLVAFLGGQAILAGKGAGVSLSAPGELRAVLGGGLYLTLLAVFALGLGGILRHTAGAISAFVGLVLVLPAVVSPLPSPWGRDIARYLPSLAGQAMFNVRAGSGLLPPWAGLAVLCGWTAAALGGAAWLITRRDA
jgi:ABC-type transport system involved in multi-copper enzyme maturation permease subunit